MSKSKMCAVVALVTLEVPVAPEDAVAGERKKSVPPGTRLNFEAAMAGELVKAGAVSYAAEDDVAPARRIAVLEGAELHQAIGQALRSIDPAEGLTAEGKVSIYALESVLGFRPSVEDRDAAHEVYSGKRPDLFGEVAAGEGNDPIADVVEAIGKLDPANKSFWTKTGLADLRALGEVLGRSVTVEERDAAMVLIAAAAV